ncbi:hypothetical protein FIBSPDRAFT_859601 [Athelia psychrophila]|uniref:Uncharacterized protein n=1 Tax=Athelia psychrophila TaxID=1759441 RepID=A0A166KVF2_9AGAM|nr:hypothetical protein FIBSPDRAFT_859601 [Fibularhizoctonia sp. CBS 109695]
MHATDEAVCVAIELRSCIPVAEYPRSASATVRTEYSGVQGGTKSGDCRGSSKAWMDLPLHSGGQGVRTHVDEVGDGEDETSSALLQIVAALAAVEDLSATWALPFYSDVGEETVFVLFHLAGGQERDYRLSAPSVYTSSARPVFSRHISAQHENLSRPRPHTTTPPMASFRNIHGDAHLFRGQSGGTDIHSLRVGARPRCLIRNGRYGASTASRPREAHGRLHRRRLPLTSIPIIGTVNRDDQTRRIHPVNCPIPDIFTRTTYLAAFNELTTCGGFSYGGVLGAGTRWAHLLLSCIVRLELSAFCERKDTSALAVYNGYQCHSQLHEIIPGAQGWPDFKPNWSK